MMNTPFDLFANPWWSHVVAAMGHTLWQGAAASVLLILVLRLLPARQANLRPAE